MQEGTFAGTNTGKNDTTPDVTDFTIDRRRRRVLAASTLVGDRVRNSAGEDLGKVERIMIDLPSGRVAYVVLSFGGFMGIGDKLFAVPWDALRIDEGEHQFVLDVDRATLAGAPGFDKNAWPDMADPTFGAAIHRHYGRAPYWEHDVTDAGDYVGDERQTNRSIEYEPTVGYRAGGTKRQKKEDETMAKVSTLEELFLDEIEDLYDAEKQLTKALPKMAKAATSDQLRQAFEQHLEQTRGHVERLEQVFDALGEKAKSKKCEAMQGLVKEGDEIASNTEETAVRDAGLIAGAQKVEHYEIAGYGSARTHAQLLGHDRIASLLEQTLGEEKETDAKLSQIAQSMVNEDAARMSSGSRTRTAGTSVRH